MGVKSERGQKMEVQTQREVDSILKWGIVFSLLWLAGVGSLMARGRAQLATARSHCAKHAARSGRGGDRIGLATSGLLGSAGLSTDQ